MTKSERESSGQPEELSGRAETNTSAAARSGLLARLRSTVVRASRKLRLAWISLRLNFARRADHPRPRTTYAGATFVVLRRFGIVTALVAVFGILAALAVSGAMLWSFRDMPLQGRASPNARPALLLEAATGEPLGRIGPFKAPDATPDDIPQVLIDAVLSIEDRRFYHHFGVDPIGLVRAMRHNLDAGKIVEGGSTVTQQLVKNQLVGNEQTYSRKLREALMAILLEFRVSKDEILNRYLNCIYMGSGAHGMTAAARLYFDKQLSELTLPEAAMLAGLIKAPSHYTPLRNLRLAQERADVVIDAMLENGVISEEAARQAKAHPATLKPAPEAAVAESWFANWAAQQASEITGSLSHSVRVRTTVVPELQLAAERIVNRTLAREGKRKNVSQGALVALGPDGAVLAMVGGRNYAESQFNRAVEANRQPGSAFKLFVYLAALRNGYSPNDMIDAGDIQIKKWQPENFSGKRYGQMTVAESFVRSVNTAAVRLAMDVGVDKVIAAARDLGLDAPLPKVPSLALGVAEVSLLDLTGAYASVRAGHKVEPWGIAAIGTGTDSALRSVGPFLRSDRSIQPYYRSMTDMLRQVVEHGTGHRASLDGFAAGKTGTSQNHRDAWFVGFGESLTVGVWVGNDDSTPMKGVVGGTLPAEIWKHFMTEARDIIERPNNYKIASTSSDTGTSFASGETPEFNTDIINRTSTDALCDIQACSASYRSFRATDCTYQPYSGPRRLCTRGNPDRHLEFSAHQPGQSGSDTTAESDTATHSVVRIYRGGRVVEFRVPKEARAQADTRHERSYSNHTNRHHRSFSDYTY